MRFVRNVYEHWDDQSELMMDFAWSWRPTAAEHTTVEDIFILYFLKTYPGLSEDVKSVFRSQRQKISKQPQTALSIKTPFSSKLVQLRCLRGWEGNLENLRSRCLRSNLRFLESIFPTWKNGFEKAQVPVCLRGWEGTASVRSDVNNG